MSFYWMFVGAGHTSLGRQTGRRECAAKESAPPGKGTRQKDFTNFRDISRLFVSYCTLEDRQSPTKSRQQSPNLVK